MTHHRPDYSIRPGVLFSLALLVLTALTLLWMGREPIAASGNIKLWHGEVVSSENSQHISDWYTPSHIIHGLFFYWLFWVIAKTPHLRFPMGARLALATLLECAWEIAENTDAVIQRYREATIALDYFGDSVLNSVADIGAMWLGFFIAARAPIWVSLGLAVVFELVTMAIIRDGLLLNVLMLLYPIDAVGAWQAGR